MNLAKGFLIDRDLIGEYTGRWLEIRSHYLNGPAFGGLVGTARGFGNSSKTSFVSIRRFSTTRREASSMRRNTPRRGFPWR